MKLSRTEIEQVLQALRPNETAQSAGKAHLHLVGGKKSAKPSKQDVDRIKQICEMIAAMPEVRPERLVEVIDAVEHGDYDPSSLDVAEKMLGRILADKIK